MCGASDSGGRAGEGGVGLGRRSENHSPPHKGEECAPGARHCSSFIGGQSLSFGNCMLHWSGRGGVALPSITKSGVWELAHSKS